MRFPRLARIRHTFEASDFAPGQLILGPNQLVNADHLAPRRAWYQVRLVDEKARQVVTTAGFRIRFADVEEID